MNKKGISIYDIAKEAGVSIATVSRTINMPEKVNEQTREKVHSIMELLNYTPNALAQSLVSRSTRTFGVIISNIKNPFHGELLRSIEVTAAELDYSILLGHTARNFEREQKYVENFKKKKVDGIILSGGRSIGEDYIRHIERTAESVPVVLTNHLLNKPNVYCVVTDETTGSYQAVNHLIERGSTKIAYINGFRHTYTNVVKEESYIRCLSQHGLSIDEKMMVNVQNDDMEGGFRACEELLSRGVSFDAIFAANDLMAIGAMRKLISIGVRIPEDVAVVGYDDIDICGYMSPTLSSVTQNLTDMGRIAIELLDRLSNDQPVTKITYLEPKLIIRESSMNS